MDRWKLSQYKHIYDLFRANFSPNMQGKIDHRLGTLVELGNECRPPVSKSLGDGLFELCANEDNKWARLVFFFMPNRTICFVHAFFKKTNKTSPNDIKIAKKNRKIIKEERGETNVINITH